MQKELKSIRLKNSYVNTWPYAQRKKSLPEPSPRFEEALVIILISIPFQIVLGGIFMLLMNLF